MSSVKGNVAPSSAEVFDFSKTSQPESTSWLKLGHYWLSIASCKFEQPEGNNSLGTPKSAYIEVLFKGKSGQVMEKFFVGPKAGVMKRLQYLHFAVTGKDCTRAFKSVEEVGKYYETILNDERVTSKQLAMTVSGTQAPNGKIYGNLGYADFVMDTELARKQGFEDEAFEEGTANWGKHLKIQVQNASHKTADAMIGGPSSSPAPDTSDDLPF